MLLDNIADEVSLGPLGQISQVPPPPLMLQTSPSTRRRSRSFSKDVAEELDVKQEDGGEKGSGPAASGPAAGQLVGVVAGNGHRSFNPDAKVCLICREFKSKSDFAAKSTFCKNPCKQAVDCAALDAKREGEVAKAKFEDSRRNRPDELAAAMRVYMRQCPSVGRGRKRAPFGWCGYLEQTTRRASCEMVGEKEWFTKEEYVEFLTKRRRKSYIDAEACWDQASQDNSVRQLKSDDGELMLPLIVRTYQRVTEGFEKSRSSQMGTTVKKNPKIQDVKDNNEALMDGSMVGDELFNPLGNRAFLHNFGEVFKGIDTDGSNAGSSSSNLGVARPGIAEEVGTTELSPGPKPDHWDKDDDICKKMVVVTSKVDEVTKLLKASVVAAERSIQAVAAGNIKSDSQAVSVDTCKDRLNIAEVLLHQGPVDVQRLMQSLQDARSNMQSSEPFEGFASLQPCFCIMNKLKEHLQTAECEASLKELVKLKSDDCDRVRLMAAAVQRISKSVLANIQAKEKAIARENAKAQREEEKERERQEAEEAKQQQQQKAGAAARQEPKTSALFTGDLHCAGFWPFQTIKKEELTTTDAVVIKECGNPYIVRESMLDDVVAKQLKSSLDGFKIGFSRGGGTREQWPRLIANIFVATSRRPQ